MKINIYKNDEILLSIPGENTLTNFFKNRESVTYTIEPNPKIESRHILRYVFQNKDFAVGIDDIMAESILNEYRTEQVDE
jgi:hypothetical protein